MLNLAALLHSYKWKHPHPQLQIAWNLTEIGGLIFPFIPIAGLPFLLSALVITWVKSSRKILSHPPNWGLVALSGWLLIISFTAPNPGEAGLGLANFLPFFLFFAAYSVSIQTPAQLRRLAWIFVIGALPIMLCGWGQIYWGWGGTLPLLGKLIELFTMVPGGDPPGRMASIFMHANSLAAYLQMVFIFGLGLAIDTYERQPTNWQIRICWLLLYLGLCGTCLVLTSSRSGWTIMVISSLMFTLYCGWYWAIGLVSTLATVVISAAYSPPPLREPLRTIVPRYFWARITDEMYPDRPEAITRLAQWKFAWKLTQERPLTGWGLQSFGKLYEAHAHLWLGYPHSLLLMLSSNVGIPATLSICALVGWILAQGTYLLLHFPLCWRSERTIFFTYLIAVLGFIIFNINDVTLVDLRLNTLAWLLLASIYGMVRHRVQGIGEI